MPMPFERWSSSTCKICWLSSTGSAVNKDRESQRVPPLGCAVHHFSIDCTFIVFKGSEGNIERERERERERGRERVCANERERHRVSERASVYVRVCLGESERDRA